MEYTQHRIWVRTQNTRGPKHSASLAYTQSYCSEQCFSKQYLLARAESNPSWHELSLFVDKLASAKRAYWIMSRSSGATCGPRKSFLVETKTVSFARVTMYLLVVINWDVFAKLYVKSELVTDAVHGPLARCQTAGDKPTLQSFNFPSSPTCFSSDSQTESLCCNIVVPWKIKDLLLGSSVNCLHSESFEYDSSTAMIDSLPRFAVSSIRWQVVSTSLKEWWWILKRFGIH